MSEPRDPLAILDARFERAIRAALGDDAPAEIQTLVKPSRGPEFGDYQSNAAMPLAKAIGVKPRDLAQRIVDELEISDIAESPEIAGPGFINITIRTRALDDALSAMDTAGLGIDAPSAQATIVVDLGGVNLAKVVHAGHLRSTVIGDALARLHERLGHRVIRQNHFGDWGLPIAMVVHIVRERMAAGELDLDAITVDDLQAIYRESKARAGLGQVEGRIIAKHGLGPKVEAEWEDDITSGAAFRAACGETLVKLQSGDAETLAVWERISRVTLDAWDAVCRTLRANLTDEHTAGESSYRHELPGLVQDLEERGVAVESDGALVVPLEEFGIREPCLVRKRDGGYLYATTDLAAIRRRVQELGADRVIYAVDIRQSLHFRQVFAAAEKAGYSVRGERGASLEHAAFGMVLGADGRVLKSRAGETVRLADLLGEGIARARSAVAEKNPDLPADEADAVAEDVGVGAIKYADLSSDRIKDYVFDFDRMLAFEGNTGPYLQYARVRVRSIFRKAEAEFGVDPAAYEGGVSAASFAIAEPEEKALALHLLRYPSAVQSAAESLEPHRLCTYLFELASLFSAFFNACPVLRAPDERTRDARLRLCALTGRVLADGLHDLGIPAPDRM